MVKILMESHDNHLKVIYILLLRFIRPWVSVSENISPTSGYCSTNRKARKYTALKTNSYQKHIKFLRVRTPDPSPTPNPEKREDPPSASCTFTPFVTPKRIRIHLGGEVRSPDGLLPIAAAGFLDPKWKRFAQFFSCEKQVLYVYYQILVNCLLSLHIFFQTCGSIFMCIIYTIIHIRLTISAKPQHVTFPAGP